MQQVNDGKLKIVGLSRMLQVAVVECQTCNNGTEVRTSAQSEVIVKAKRISCYKDLF